MKKKLNTKTFAAKTVNLTTSTKIKEKKKSEVFVLVVTCFFVSVGKVEEVTNVK
jgi:hypothetical protein